MKKLFNLIVFMLLCVPFMVDAEVKKVDDIVYTIESKTIYDYLCDDIKGHELVAIVIDEGIIEVVDFDTDKSYIVDLSKPKSCTEFPDDYEYPEYNGAEIPVFTLNNKFYMEYYDGQVWGEFIKTEDNEIDYNKVYYKRVEEYGNTYYYPILKEEINVNNIENYYEMFQVLEADSYDENETYYGYDEDFNIILADKEKVKEEYEQDKESIYNYVVVVEPTSRELIAEFDTDTFIAPKEKTGYDKDIKFIISDSYYTHFEVDGTMYVALYNWEDDKIAIFDIEGNYQTLGEEALYIKDLSISEKTGYIVMIKGIDEQEIAIYDSKLNLVYSNEKDIAYTNIILSNEEKECILEYFFDELNNTYEIGEITILNKYYLVSEDELKYSNADLSFKFSGDLDRLTSVKINDKKLAKDNYLSKKGSTLVTLKNEYLSTLAPGKYTLKVEYSDGGYSAATFEIKETSQQAESEVQPEELPKNPDTYDGIANSIIFIIISLLGLSISTMYLKKKAN